MAQIFISYRRKDSATITHSIYEQLTVQFGKGRVFMDSEVIRGGESFKEAIAARIKKTDVLLVVIGKNWLNELEEKKKNGQEDYVQFELELAHSSGVNIIPVLVNDAVIPSPELLPAELDFLREKHALPVRVGSDFRRDINRLVKDILKFVSTQDKFVRFFRKNSFILLIPILTGVSLLVYPATNLNNTQPIERTIEEDPCDWGAEQVDYNPENKNHKKSESIEKIEHSSKNHQFIIDFKAGEKSGWFIAYHLNITDGTEYYVKYLVHIKKPTKCQKIPKNEST